MSYNAKLRSNNEIRNHEGAKAWMQTPEFELYSTVVCTMSLDDKFYESGSNRINRIASLVRMVPAEYVAQLAIYARTEMHLRSVPMLLLVELSQCHSGDSLVSRATAQTIQRVDDITELLACYQWRHRSRNLKRLSNQLRKGIALSFNQFDEYQFAKYKCERKSVTLRDALFLTHPKAKDEAQQRLFDKIAHDKLQKPYTWETQLSEAGQEKGLTAEERKAQKRETWTELIQSRRMGYMAMLRNLRNMLSAGVSTDTMQIVYDYLSDERAVKKSKQLPFRFFSAYLMMTGCRKTTVIDTSKLNPFAEIFANSQNNYYKLSSMLWELKHRYYYYNKRKVCKKRQNTGTSSMLSALDRADLLKENAWSWHVAHTVRRRAEKTHMSNRLSKYCNHLSLLESKSKKHCDRISCLWQNFENHHPSVKKIVSKPFYAPLSTLDCLEVAAQHSASSIPAFDESTRVCIACDTSGSMIWPVSGDSVMKCYDLALFFGAMMKYRYKNAIVGIFGDTWLPVDMPEGNIMQNVLKMRSLEGRVGLATNGHEVINWLQMNRKVMDKVMIFTDCQLWNNRWGDACLSSAWHSYKRTIAPDAKLYLFDLEGHGQNPIDVDGEKDVYCIGGWSDKVFDILAALENGKSVIDEIRRIVV